MGHKIVSFFRPPPPKKNPNKTEKQYGLKTSWNHLIRQWISMFFSPFYGGNYYKSISVPGLQFGRPDDCFPNL